MTLEREHLSLLFRIIRSQEGRDFINLVLLPLTNENYQDILASNETNRAELIGKGIQLKELITMLETAEQKLSSFSIVEAPDRL